MSKPVRLGSHCSNSPHATGGLAHMHTQELTHGHSRNQNARSALTATSWKSSAHTHCHSMWQETT